MNKTIAALIVIVLVAIVAFASWSVYNAQSAKSKELPKENVITQHIQPTPDNIERVIIGPDNDPFLGPSEAPITIIEFGDFQCSFCARFHKETFPLIKKNYIDTGKIKFVYRDFPLTVHQYAEKAAEASECAHEQDAANNDTKYAFFWKYHNKLFENQNALDVDSLNKYANDISLNAKQFNECLDSGKMRLEVENDAVDGTVSGVTATPYFFINGIPVDGAYPYEVFEKIIESELARSRKV